MFPVALLNLIATLLLILPMKVWFNVSMLTTTHVLLLLKKTVFTTELIQEPTKERYQNPYKLRGFVLINFCDRVKFI